MQAKIAFRNVKRSARDFTIFFVTLMIAVTIFYAFNSITDQQIMRDIDAKGNMEIIDLMNTLMSFFSIVVAFVLGFLVIYSNQLLIRRRKREFGMYSLLGMTSGQVSRIIVYETVFVGAVSLAVGLALGLLTSQLLSFASAALFEVPLPNYTFDFSLRACAMTLVCFVAIFLIVTVFNVISVKRRKLIDLLGSSSKSQRVIIRNPWLCLVLFIVSIGIIACSYWELKQNGMTMIMDREFVLATVLMLVGTLLFFFSLSGFLIAIVSSAKGFYLRGLRPFTIRQVASKVNTSFFSMWVVCVLVFLAITTFATGMGLISIFTGDIKAANPYDASIIITNVAEAADDEPGSEVADELPEGASAAVRSEDGTSDPATGTSAEAASDPARGRATVALESIMGSPDWDSIASDYAYLSFYRLESPTIGELMESTGMVIETGTDSLLGQSLDVVGISQLNEALSLQGRPAVTLDDGKYVIANNLGLTDELASAMARSGYALKVGASDLSAQRDVLDVQLYDFSTASTSLTIVVPDEVLAVAQAHSESAAVGGSVAANPSMAVVNIAFKGGQDDVKEFNSILSHSETKLYTIGLTRDEMVSQALTLRTLITYLALYIGLVLLLATAAVLAIQLIALTIDSTRRYKMLSNLGCDGSMIGKSLFAQVLIYFLFPLGLAICHSACAILVLSNSLFTAYKIDSTGSILLSGALLLVVYGIYMLVTYLASRESIRASGA